MRVSCSPTRHLRDGWHLVSGVGTSAVVDALNHIVLIGAILAYAAAVACLFLIRQKDVVVQGGPPAGRTPQDASATSSATGTGTA